jgi:hypothetical protein
MAPPLIALVFFIAVIAVVAIGGFVAMRTGLWVRETSTRGPIEDTPPTRGRVSRGTERRFEHDDAGEGEDRPEHVAREDETKSRFIGT